MRAERVTDAVCFHGEGPVWWDRWQQLRFVDMYAGDVLTLDGDRVRRTSVGAPVAAVIRPRMGGGAIVARQRDLAISNFDDLSDLAGFVDITDDPTVRCNEGGCDPDGAFWIGTLTEGFPDGSSVLYQLDARSRRVHTVLAGLTISNGIGWSPDTQTMYLNDSGTGTTWAFDYDPVDGISGRRVFASDFAAGVPDGLCVDADGGVWTAQYDGGRVQRFSPSGKLEAVIEVPGISKVTACCFGGAELDTLYLTTSRENLPPDAEPAAGGRVDLQLPPGCGGDAGARLRRLS